MKIVTRLTHLTRHHDAMSLTSVTRGAALDQPVIARTRHLDGTRME